MTTNQERMQILKMLEVGQISAEEASKLLKALEASTEAEPERIGQANWFRVRVTDTQTGRSKVNVNIPMELVNMGLKIGARFAPDIGDLDFEEVIEAIRSGAQGRIIDVEDEEEGERVEIFVE
ncbi:MAG: hypothetical protein U9Q78_03240 [Chloroflexota bacterium]|nr:hypothetical protein [Chloroflexota bacterium]